MREVLMCNKDEIDSGSRTWRGDSGAQLELYAYSGLRRCFCFARLPEAYTKHSTWKCGFRALHLIAYRVLS